MTKRVKSKEIGGGYRKEEKGEKKKKTYNDCPLVFLMMKDRYWQTQIHGGRR